MAATALLKDLADEADDDGTFSEWAKVSVEATSVSIRANRKTVMRAFDELVSFGVLKRTKGPRTNTYSLVLAWTYRPRSVPEPVPTSIPKVVPNERVTLAATGTSPASSSVPKVDSVRYQKWDPTLKSKDLNQDLKPSSSTQALQGDQQTLLGTPPAKTLTQKASKKKGEPQWSQVARDAAIAAYNARTNKPIGGIKPLFCRSQEMLDAGRSVDEIVRALTNAKAFTQAAVEFELNNNPTRSSKRPAGWLQDDGTVIDI